MRTERTIGRGAGGERGQVGIGTLIVFIAMVLVAALAAGVLIETASFLQSKSEKTGQQSSSQVTDRIQAVTTIGNVNESNDPATLSHVNVTVKKAPGADQVDVENVTVEWIGPTGTYTLVNESSTSDSQYFTIESIKDSDGSLPVLNTRDDRFELIFTVGRFATRELEGGESVKIRLTTKFGGTTTVRLSIPAAISGESSVTL